LLVALSKDKVETETFWLEGDRGAKDFGVQRRQELPQDRTGSLGELSNKHV
jgi:hypothetical protein